MLSVNLLFHNDKSSSRETHSNNAHSRIDGRCCRSCCGILRSAQTLNRSAVSARKRFIHRKTYSPINAVCTRSGMIKYHKITPPASQFTTMETSQKHIRNSRDAPRRPTRLVVDLWKMGRGGRKSWGNKFLTQQEDYTLEEEGRGGPRMHLGGRTR